MAIRIVPMLSRTRTMNLAGRRIALTPEFFPLIIGKFAPLQDHATFSLNA